MQAPLGCDRRGLEQRVEQRTREAEAANLSKTRFLAAISHDVLQPINAARLFTSALREAAADPAEQQRLAERVDASLRDAEELLDGLLDISRLDAGSLKPELSVFRLDELLASVAGQYAPLAASRGLGFRVHAGPLSVRSDRRLLRRALQNFVANALRYTQHGGVLMAARARGDRVDLAGPIRLAAPMSFGIKVLGAPLAAFLAMHPAVEIEVMLSDARHDLIAEGIDLSLRIASMEDSSLLARTIAPVAASTPTPMMPPPSLPLLQAEN